MSGELGAKSRAGSWSRRGVEGENSLAESVVGLYLAGLNGWAGLDGEDKGKLHLSMEGRTVGRETCREATPRPGNGRRASREPELVFGAQCGDGGWARARGLETIASAYSCLPGTVGDGSNSKGSALPGSWRQPLLPEHCLRSPKGLRSWACQPVPNVLGRLQRI